MLVTHNPLGRSSFTLGWVKPGCVHVCFLSYQNEFVGLGVLIGSPHGEGSDCGTTETNYGLISAKCRWSLSNRVQTELVLLLSKPSTKVRKGHLGRAKNGRLPLDVWPRLVRPYNLLMANQPPKPNKHHGECGGTHLGSIASSGASKVIHFEKQVLDFQLSSAERKMVTRK